jgi:uncharacterized protein YjbI with pentapeptide repeats
MDEDARRLLELLRPAVERAEQIGQQQQSLLQRHEESAQAFADQIGRMTEAAETERARLLAEREAAVAQAREETIAIVAAARAEEEAARARIAELLQAQAQREAAHAAKLAAAEAEREELIRQREAEQLERLRLLEAERAAAEAEREELIRQREAEQLERLRLREAEHGARIDRLLQQGLESLAERERAFEAACAEKQARLQALCRKEGEISARAREMQELVRTDGEDAFVVVSVGGRQFETTIGCLTRFPHSTLAVLWHDHRTREDKTASPLRVQGDPSLFHLILNHLACPDELPVVSDVAQIQWLERESKRYGLDELELQCRDAYKRLDTVKVMQLLNGQRNLSGMDMRRLDLSYIDFRGASMYGARVDEAILSDALLSDQTNLQHVSMCRVHASRANFSLAYMLSARMIGACLTEAVLHRVRAEKADFSKAELSGANFNGAELQNASFTEAVAPKASFVLVRAEKADFSKADLSDANLNRSVLSHANLSQANLKGADLSDADLQHANLSDADLSRAKLTGAKLSVCNLSGATLPPWSSGLMQGVKLAGATGWVPADRNMSHAKLKGADLSGADLKHADLSEADLSDADLRDADLSGANLRSADLTAAALSGARLCGAMLAGARGGRAATVQVQPADGEALSNALKVGKPVVVALTAARALRLRSVAVVNSVDDRNREGHSKHCVKSMEVCTGPAAHGPWISVVTFTSAKTKDLQTFAAAPDSPALGGFVRVLVHDTHGDEAYVNEVLLEGEAWGPAA